MAFYPGDIAKTLLDEYDIELIPAGTLVTLLRYDGDAIWRCHGKINNNNRTLLIFQANLTLVEPCGVVEFR